MRAARAVLLLSSVFLLLSAACAAAAWKVELVSGGTIEANTYRVEKGRIILGYPAGEAAFPVSGVKSVQPDSGNVEIFQEKAVRQAAENPQGRLGPGAPDTAPGGPSPSVQAAPPGPPAGQWQSGTMPAPAPEPDTMPKDAANPVQVKRSSIGSEYDPEAEEVISGLEMAQDKASQAELEKKMNRLFK